MNDGIAIPAKAEDLLTIIDNPINLNGEEMTVKLEANDVIAKHHFTLRRIRFTQSNYDGTQSKPIVREVFDRGDAVGIILYDPDMDMVVLVEQARAGAIVASINHPELSAWTLELVAGCVDEGEDPKATAIREALEEVGAAPRNVHKLMTFMPSPGGCSEVMHLFYGEIDSNLVQEFGGIADHNEDIRVVKMPVDELLRSYGDTNRIVSGPLALAMTLGCIPPGMFD